MGMLRCFAATIVCTIGAAGCGDGTDSVAPSAMSTSVPAEPSTTSCDGPAPAVQLIANDVVIDMDLISITRSCGYDGDGAAMFDPSYRPAALAIATQRLEVSGLPASAEVKIDVRPLTSASSVLSIQPAEFLEPGADGTYVAELPGEGCLLVTVAWSTSTESGHHVALVQTNGAIC
jgi:hypothetical protein